MGSDVPSALLERTLRTNAYRACIESGVQCQIGGKPAIPPNTLFSDFWFRSGTTKPIEKKGEQRELTVGLIQFSLHEPLDYDHSRAVQIAKAIAQAFTRKKWPVPPRGYVLTHRLGHVTLPRMQNRKQVIVVDGSFEFLHPAPAPILFAL